MSFEIALASRLKAADGMAGVSVEWERRPQGKYPAVVLTIAFWSRRRHMTGFDEWQQPRVQIDVFALANPTKVAVRNAVVAAIAPSGVVGGIQFGCAQDVSVVGMGDDDGTDFVFRDMIEAVVPHLMEN